MRECCWSASGSGSEMPECCAVPSLEEAVREWVCRWLLHTVARRSSPWQRQRQRLYLLSVLPPRPRQELLDRLLAARGCTADLKCPMVEVLGDASTWAVDFTEGDSLFVEEAFHLYRSLTLAAVVNLTRLGVVCDMRARTDRRFLIDVNSSLHRVLGLMRQLVWVTLAGLGDATVLATLGANCHLLQHLDVSCSPRVDDEGVASLLLRGPVEGGLGDVGRLAAAPLPPLLPCCASLTFVGVGSTEAGGASALLLLRCLPRLTSLGGYLSDCSLLQVLQMLQSPGGGGGGGGGGGAWRSSLTALWEPRILPQQVALLAAACPRLTSLVTEEASVSALALLPPLPRLTVELQLRGSPDQLYCLLEVRGSSLTHLALLNNDNCPLEMTWLMGAAPRLQHLEAFLYLGEEEEQEGAGPGAGWAALASMVVALASCKAVVALLTHTPALRRLSLSLMPEPYTETWRDLDDTVVAQVVCGGGLAAVEELVVQQCGVTARGLMVLLQHCPRLTLLAPLINWPSLSEADLRRLRQEATRRNWRLHLLLRHDAPLLPAP